MIMWRLKRCFLPSFSLVHLKFDIHKAGYLPFWCEVSPNWSRFLLKCIASLSINESFKKKWKKLKWSILGKLLIHSNLPLHLHSEWKWIHFERNFSWMIQHIENLKFVIYSVNFWELKQRYPYLNYLSRINNEGFCICNGAINLSLTLLWTLQL